MSPLNHKSTTSSLVPPIFYVAKNGNKKIEGFPLNLVSFQSSPTYTHTYTGVSNKLRNWNTYYERYAARKAMLSTMTKFELETPLLIGDMRDRIHLYM